MKDSEKLIKKIYERINSADWGDIDPYWMAAAAIDEAVRNCVAVGADPQRIAILDNFCWGTTDRPETLGSLVRAALACHDMAIALGTPSSTILGAITPTTAPNGTVTYSFLYSYVSPDF